MASVYLFRFLLYSHLALLLSTGYGNGNHDKCPQSFDCGDLGRFCFPFTKAELPDCGLITLQGCDDPKSQIMIELEKNGRPLLLTEVIQQDKVIAVFDQDLQERLKSKRCDVFNSNTTLPRYSPLVSFEIRNNLTLFRCNRTLNVNPPPGIFNYNNCPDYNIYYYGSSYLKKDRVLSPFSACSILQLPIGGLADNGDLASIISGNMLIEVRLSDNCDKCYNHMGGQCQLDRNNNFYCYNAAPAPAPAPSARAMHKSKAWKPALGLGLGFFGVSGILIIWRLVGRPRKWQSILWVPLFSYKELEKVTSNFDRSQELGNGAFGTVYYGKLRDGREVAVKRLYNYNYRRVEQFMNEVDILTRLRHQNLVSLYGCTSRQSRELLLVYEYIPNGTASSHLHGGLSNRRLLPWPIRIKIAIETATALAYLHTFDTIHRDVKTNNILLDNNYSVKVADFGLSRLFPNDVTHVSTAPQGTPGYIDPEYYQCYQLTSKSDVYSFGVVLIELISYMPAVAMSRPKDKINLANLAIKRIQRSALKELVDPSLSFESDNELKRMIVSVAELAFRCLQRDKDLRPSMDEVLEILRSIESGKDELKHLEEVDIHGTREPYNGTIYPFSPPLPDGNEIELLKNIKSLPSPKAVTDKWHSESTTTNASA